MYAAKYRFLIHKMKCYITYGFVANLKNTIWDNTIETSKNMPTKIYLNTLKNKIPQSIQQPPLGLSSLLGLGHKFIIQNKFPEN